MSEPVETPECVICGSEFPETDYDGLCEFCYVKANPHLDTSIGINCDMCGDDLRMYGWCKDYSVNKCYCIDCYNQIAIEEETDNDETEYEFRVRTGAIKMEE